MIELRKQLKEIVGNLSLEETSQGMLVVHPGEGFGMILSYACFYTGSITIYKYNACFFLQSSSMQFMQAQAPTVGKFLGLESNLWHIEGLPTCNLDKCKAS